MDDKIITHVCCFTNGQTMVFDQNGQQMPKYQGPTTEVLPLIRAAGFTGEIEQYEWGVDGMIPIHMP